MSDDEDVPQLSAETLAVLQEFLREDAEKDQQEANFNENWQLSQFWYDEATADFLSQAAVALCRDNNLVALISCPTLYKPIKAQIELSQKNIHLQLFEFDKRFSAFGSEFVFYDYNAPLNVDGKFKHSFDVILADPPFLSDECLMKTVETIKFLSKPSSKIILCTGAVMESLANHLLNLKKCQFEPKHRNNLSNEFICLSNFGELTV